MITSKTINLPGWVNDELRLAGKIEGDKAKMDFVLDLAIKNVERNTGGPFAAAVFDSETDELISVGVNCVVDNNCSIAHAEIVAIINAQEKLNSYRLDDVEYVLFSSAQPCVMCNGAFFWSGIKTLVYGATKNDVEQIVGFDEGPIHPHWYEEFKNRGISVVRNVLPEKSREVLQLYKDKEGILY